MLDMSPTLNSKEKKNHPSQCFCLKSESQSSLTTLKRAILAFSLSNKLCYTKDQPVHRQKCSMRGIVPFWCLPVEME